MMVSDGPRGTGGCLRSYRAKSTCSGPTEHYNSPHRQSRTDTRPKERAYRGEADKAAKPALLHIAEEDSYASKDSQLKMKAGLTAPHVELDSDPGRDHAFARHGCKHFHAPDARTADTRTLDFFRKHLR